MSVFEGLAAAGTILIWVACHPDQHGPMVTSIPEPLPRVMSVISGSVFLLELGSVIMSMAHVTTGGHRNKAC